MSEKIRFWVLLGLLAASILLVWWLNTNLSQVLVNNLK